MKTTNDPELVSLVNSMSSKCLDLEEKVIVKDFLISDLEYQLEDYKSRVERMKYLVILCHQIAGLEEIIDNDERNKIIVDTIKGKITMADDFERLLNAIKKEPTVMDAWENLLFTMRLCGLDEKNEDNR